MDGVVVPNNKHATKACVGCQKQKRRCSGTMPCELCVLRGRTCEFSGAPQARRGPKRKIIFMGPEGYELQTPQHKVLQTSVNAPAENALWSGNERMKIIDSMLKIRGWLRPLLDHDALQNSNVLAIHIQSLCLSAAMARYNGYYDQANHFLDSAGELSNQLFDDNTPEVAVAFMLLGDVSPKKCKYYSICAWNSAKKFSLSTVRESRLHAYIYLFYLFFADSDVDVRALLTQYERQMNDRKFSADIWDIMSVLIIRVLGVILTKFGFFYADINDAIRLINNVQNSVFSKADLDSIAADLKMLEWIVESNIDMFGREFHFWYRSIQIFVTWKRGEKDQAFADAMQFLSALRNSVGDRAFLVDMTMYVILVSIMLEKGMIQPMKEGVDFLALMLQSTQQHELSTAVIPYLTQNQSFSPTTYQPTPPTNPDQYTPPPPPQSLPIPTNTNTPIPSYAHQPTTHSYMESYPPPLPQSFSEPSCDTTSPYSDTIDSPSPPTPLEDHLMPTSLSMAGDISFFDFPNDPEFRFALH